jgi:N-acetylmuramoyl-L-alanine amidase
MPRPALPPPRPPAPPLPPPALRQRWWHPGSWLPLLALAMLLIGAWRLLPQGPDSLDLAATVNPALPTIVVDAGHGGGDSGACNNGLREKDLALDTALRLERHLRRLGFSVVLTRRDDRFLELFERANIANQIPRALFVSIHFNDNATAGGDGIETFYAVQKAAFPATEWSLENAFHQAPEPAPADQGAGFAQCIQDNLIARMGVTNRGAKPRQLAVVRLTRCPAVLVEGGFLNNPTEARKLAQPAYREALASAIAEGVATYQAGRVADQRATTVARR